MKNTYAWGLIILVLVIVAGIYWRIMSINTPTEIVPVVTGSEAVKNPTPIKPVGTTRPAPTPVTAPGDTRPKITSLAPTSGPVGAVVTIKGVNFDATTNVITFGPSSGRHHVDGTPDNQIEAHPSADGKTLTFLVPASGPSGQLCDQSNKCVTVAAVHTKPGAYEVSIVNKNGLSNITTFTVTE